MKRFSPLVALALLFASTPGMAQDEVPEPPRYPPSTVRPKLVVGGLGLFAVMYGTGLILSEAAPDQPGFSKLNIPFVGPWMGLSENKCVEYGSTDCSPELVGRGFLYGVLGIGQIGSLALIGQALFMKTRAVAPAPPPETAFIAPVPIVTPTTVGFGFAGRF